MPAGMGICNLHEGAVPEAMKRLLGIALYAGVDSA